LKCDARDCADVIAAPFVFGKLLHFAFEHLTQKISPHAYLPLVANRGERALGESRTALNNAGVRRELAAPNYETGDFP
jgi:hypothetical protein